MRYYSIARFRIKDLQQFKAELEASDELLAKGGFKKTYVNRSVDDPNQIVVMHELTDLDQARRLYTLPEFKECIKRAGIIGEPEVMFVEELMRTPEPSAV